MKYVIYSESCKDYLVKEGNIQYEEGYYKELYMAKIFDDEAFMIVNNYNKLPSSACNKLVVLTLDEALIKNIIE